jgi:hypothetical protein
LHGAGQGQNRKAVGGGCVSYVGLWYDFLVLFVDGFFDAFPIHCPGLFSLFHDLSIVLFENAMFSLTVYCSL